MDNTKLLLRFWKDCIYGFPQPFQIIMAGNEYIYYAPLFEVRANRRIKARALIFADPNPQNILLPIHMQKGIHG
jgi:hypothetical protein